MLLFYPSPVQEEPFIQLLYEICDLEHQVMVLQCIRVMTARMCDVALPVFLPVESFIFDLPPQPSCPGQFLRVLFGDPEACQPLELRFYDFSTRFSVYRRTFTFRSL